MRFAIFGTGGVGGYFGARLAQAGRDVTFIARGSHLAAIRADGLRVDSVQGDLVLQPVQAAEDPAAVGPVDVVIVAVKAWQLEESLPQLRPLIGGGTLILPLLNGIEHMGLLAGVFGNDHLAGGLCRISARVDGPGRIRHTGIEPFIAYGEWNGEKSARILALDEAMQQVPGFTAQLHPNIELAMWEKYLLIAAFSGVGAVTRVPVGVFRSIPETRALFRRALEEVVQIANARGVALSDRSVQDVMDRIDATAPETMASMQKDILEGRPSELEAQTGALVRMAREAGLALPVQEFIYASLLPMERRARAGV